MSSSARESATVSSPRPSRISASSTPSWPPAPLSSPLTSAAPRSTDHGPHALELSISGTDSLPKPRSHIGGRRQGNKKTGAQNEHRSVPDVSGLLSPVLHPFKGHLTSRLAAAFVLLTLQFTNRSP